MGQGEGRGEEGDGVVLGDELVQGLDGRVDYHRIARLEKTVNN